MEAALTAWVETTPALPIVKAEMALLVPMSVENVRFPVPRVQLKEPGPLTVLAN